MLCVKYAISQLKRFTLRMSVDSYEVMGLRVACAEVQATRSFSLETKVYKYLKQVYNKAGWKFIRVDTTNQIGFPDCLCLKGSEYVLIEAKMLKTKKLTSVLDNMTWQPGQIPFMLQALIKKQCYLLIVAKGSKLLILGDESYVRTMLSYTDDFRFI